MKRKAILLLTLSLTFLLIISACGNSEENASDFYDGKTIEFVVTYNPGGGYDTMARSIAPYLEKYTGASVIVKNVPGGGGLLGINTVFGSKADGLTIGLLPGGVAIASHLLHSEGIVEVEGIEYDLSEFSYLGSISAGPQVLFTSASNDQLNSIEDVMNYSDELTSGHPGRYEDVVLNLMAVKNALDLPIKFAFGYDGMSNVELAVASGELEVSSGTAQDRLPKIENGELKPLLLIGQAYSGLPDVPRAIDFAENDADKQIIEAVDTMLLAGRPIVSSPGVPEDRVEYLEEALRQSLADEGLQEEWESLGWISDWTTGGELQSVINTILNDTPPELFEIWSTELENY